MINVSIDHHTANDIDAQVAKILRDLGNPDPPLRLEHVRELLTLAKEYYSTADDSTLKRFVNQLRMAGKQIAMRPAYLRDLIRDFRLDALCLLDERRILISHELPSAKQRWAEGHEIGHALISWHGSISHGDDKYSLGLEYSEILETEANYAARRLLFLRDKFDEHALSSTPSTAHVMRLKKLFGNTITTTFYGLIEIQDIPAFGLISPHPRRPGEDFDPNNPCRHFIRSQSFAQLFPQVTARELFERAQGYCGFGKWNLGKSSEVFSSITGYAYEFQMETLFNEYDALTLGFQTRKVAVALAVNRSIPFVY